jgi:5,10-methenyltetrahydromethanopterin hydrogenase
VENSHSTNNTIQALINSVDQLSNKIGVLESKFVENIENLVKIKIHEILEENIKQLIEIKYDEVNKAKMEEVVNFKINNYVKDKASELNNTSNKINNYMKACDNNISVIKSRFIYVQIDMIKLWYPNQQPSDEQLKYYIDSISRHYNLKLDFNIIKEYVQKIYV